MHYLVTGAAGFIGFHLSLKLLKLNKKVIGVDNLNDYYDVNLKQERLNILKRSYPDTFSFNKCDIENKEEFFDIFKNSNLKIIINLAAQAGVRYSLENPYAYISSNINGFLNILELAKEMKVEHLVYASSSSVYGGNKSYPFREKDNVDKPVSLYAASKKSNELMAYTYSHLYQIPTTGLRFFTVYGPWGRPDMALFLFTESILKNEKIKIFNFGEMTRDFTYIDDVVESLHKVIKKPPTRDNDNIPIGNNEYVPYKIFNIGNSNPQKLMDYINCIEKAIGIKAKKEFLPMQPGDVEYTYADTEILQDWIKFRPDTDIQKGIDNFVDWYKSYYGYP